MIIQHNIMSLNAHRQMSGNTGMVSKNLEKLSSGYKINRAGDDAAGLAISEKMRAQITGLTRAQANAQDGISLVQTAEGALTEVHSMLNRMVDLATQSSNGTMQGEDRQKIQDEMDSLTSEIDRISKSTNFNGINLLDGKLGGGDAVLTGGAKFADTKATLGKVTMAAITAGTDDLAANDVVSYTITWMDKNGKAQETKLDFTAATTTTLVGNSGATYTGTAGGTGPTAAQWTTAIKGELLADKAFSEAFTVTETGQVFTFESKTMGASGGRVMDVNIKAPSAAKAPAAGGAIDTTATKTYLGVNAGQKLDLTAAKAADTGETAAEMMKKVFTIDGKKFLALSTDVNTSEIALLDKDINTFVTGQADDTIVTGDGANAVAAINRAFGKTGSDVEFKIATTADAPANSGVTAGDILYTSKSEGLTLQIGDTADDFNKVTVSVADMGTEGLGIDAIEVGIQGVAAESIKTIKNAIETVSINRSAMGALQNRLEHTINNLGVTTENMTAAESRIRDVDMAKEMAAFTKNNVLTQAAQAMLAQANQQPQQVLQLLR